jgi:FAD/FMN-containing dehydrogenase
MDLTAFAEEVGTDGPVTAVGGRTQWHVGGPVAAGAREVRAPEGIVEYEPAEMTVRCGAGTTVREVDAAVGAHGQLVALPDAAGATVGGVLAVGQSGIRRLGYGPVRDVLLEARYVSAEGLLIKAGGATVKNVSGFDLCRLLVGSLGTIGLLGEVRLRCRPRPARSQWYAGAADPFATLRALHRPTSILWDGTTTWVLLEGHPVDVDEQARLTRLTPVEGPPPVPTAGRRSLRPGELRALTGEFVAEIGVGIVHLPYPVEPPEPAGLGSWPPELAGLDLHRRIKAAFDPTGRLNPGRHP